jgi:hypothetical protein
MRAKLHELKGELMQRRHQPVPRAGQMAGKRGARALRLLCRARQQQGGRQHAHHHLRPPPTRMQWCRHTESADMCSKANRALDTARSTN